MSGNGIEKKVRLDVLMTEKGLTESREKARALIMAGEVLVNGVMIAKAGQSVDPHGVIEIKQACPYVSRGGLKLEKAMREFSFALAGKVCADIGASTGGFTDCMLQNGAERVYAVDVGYGQLDWRLRNDARVVVMERTNARYLKAADFDPPPQFASIDVSFISLSHIFPALALMGTGEVVSLIKPQFEAGREKVGKRGVVREPQTHRDVIRAVFGYAEQNGYSPRELTYSPIKGPNGNIEYLARYVFGRPEEAQAIDIDGAVGHAFAEL